MTNREKIFALLILMLTSIFILTGCSSSGDNSVSVDAKTELVTVEAASEEGFNYDYYLYIPNSVYFNKNARLVVEPNNSGTADDDLEFHESRALRLADDHWLGNELESPVLVPAFPRPITQPNGVIEGGYAYTHSLGRQTLKVAEGEELYRIDLQLLKMIEHSKTILKQKGIEVDYKIFLNGFSASGNFVNRFAALHPNKVKALAAGGVNGIPILPYEELEGSKLTYPVGVGDIDLLVDINFDLESYRNVAQYIYMGDEDTNDTLPYGDAYDEPERQLIKDIYDTVEITEDTVNAEEIMRKRLEFAEEKYNVQNMNSEFIVYKGVGHTITTEMKYDIVSFFKKQ